MAPTLSDAMIHAILEANSDFQDDDDGLACRDTATCATTTTTAVTPTCTPPIELPECSRDTLAEAERIVSQVFSSSSAFSAFMRAPSKRTALLLYSRTRPSVTSHYAQRARTLATPATTSTTTAARPRGLTFLQHTDSCVYGALPPRQASAFAEFHASAAQYGVFHSDSDTMLTTSSPSSSSSVLSTPTATPRLDFSMDDVQQASGRDNDDQFDSLSAVSNAADEVAHRYDEIGSFNASSLGTLSLLASVGSADFSGSLSAIAHAEAMVASIFQ
jgi:hypothetical protein